MVSHRHGPSQECESLTSRSVLMPSDLWFPGDALEGPPLIHRLWVMKLRSAAMLDASRRTVTIHSIHCMSDRSNATASAKISHFKRQRETLFYPEFLFLDYDSPLLCCLFPLLACFPLSLPLVLSPIKNRSEIRWLQSMHIFKLIT